MATTGASLLALALPAHASAAPLLVLDGDRRGRRVFMLGKWVLAVDGDAARQAEATIGAPFGEALAEAHACGRFHLVPPSGLYLCWWAHFRTAPRPTDRDGLLRYMFSAPLQHLSARALPAARAARAWLLRVRAAREAREAAAMALVERLGAQSALAALPPDLLRLCLALVRAADYRCCTAAR